MLTLKAILVPITASRTSNLLRAIETLFGVATAEWHDYTFMASVRLPWEAVWEAVWETLWRAIPRPLVNGRLLLALKDSLNPPKRGGTSSPVSAPSITPPSPTRPAGRGCRRW